MSSNTMTSCMPTAISLPVTNVTLGNGFTARGIKMSVGSPSQDLAFQINIPFNNSFVYGVNGVCPSDFTPGRCQTFRGGQFDPSSSNTSGAVNRSLIYPDIGGPNFTWIADDVKLTTNVTISDMPLGIPLADWGEQGYNPMNTIGLGASSTFLNSLYNTSLLASRSWSYWFGGQGSTAASMYDGSFVVGGYDKAKTVGPGFKQPLVYRSDCPSGLLVTITGLTLNNPDGSKYPLMSPSASSSALACIVWTESTLMSMQLNPYFQTWVDDTISPGSSGLSGVSLYTAEFGRTFGTAFYTMTYTNQSHAYKGSLTINLSSGLSVTVPNEQLVIPDRTWLDSGEVYANASKTNLPIYVNQDINNNDLMKLGGRFLSSAYLMVHQDTQTFTLWPSNPNQKQSLVALGADGNPTSICKNSTSSSSGGSSTDESSLSSRTSLSGGAIAGIVIGAIAGLTLLVVAVAFLIRRRKNRQGGGASELSAQNGTHNDYKDRVGYESKVEAKPQLPLGVAVPELSAEEGQARWAELPERRY